MSVSLLHVQKYYKKKTRNYKKKLIKCVEKLQKNLLQKKIHKYYKKEILQKKIKRGGAGQPSQRRCVKGKSERARCVGCVIV